MTTTPRERRRPGCEALAGAAFTSRVSASISAGDGSTSPGTAFRTVVLALLDSRIDLFEADAKHKLDDDVEASY